jgi:hypothetical protein
LREHAALKLALMEKAGDLDARACAAAFLALVLRHSQRWFLDTQKGYARFDIRWALNLGIPSAGYDDEAIRDAFGSVAVAAWKLSCLDGPVTLDLASGIVREALDSPLTPAVSVAVVPEVAAEVASYARSPLRSEGLHVLVDVGASTLDVCSFVLHRQGGDDRYSLLTARVETLGALMLHWHRIERLGEHRVLPQIAALPLDDLEGCVPDDVYAYVHDTRDRALEAVDELFAKRCLPVVTGTLADLKKRRDPHSPRWVEGLPLFACGGGSRLGFYKRLLEQADIQLRSSMLAKGLIIRRLPTPDDFKGLPIGDGFDRLAVAYGLSYDSLDIGHIEPPSGIEDLSGPPVRRYWEGYVSKDFV